MTMEEWLALDLFDEIPEGIPALDPEDDDDPEELMATTTSPFAARDGDGDGLIDDGTPSERPAPPTVKKGPSGSRKGPSGGATDLAVFDGPLPEATVADMKAGHPPGRGGSAVPFLVDKDGAQVFLPDRATYHKEYAAKVLANARKPEGKPAYNVLGGGPASGKSTIVKARRGTPGDLETNTAVVNADDAKEALPDWDVGIKAGDTTVAGYVHEESSHMANTTAMLAIGKGLNLTLDGTGDSSLGKMRAKLDAARAQGYQINGVYVTIPTEIAVERAMSRAMRRGRYVNTDVIRGTHRNVSAVLPDLIDDFDTLEVWDNTGSTPVLMLSKELGGQPVIQDPALWEAFKGKATEGAPAAPAAVTAATDPETVVPEVEITAEEWFKMNREVVLDVPITASLYAGKSPAHRAAFEAIAADIAQVRIEHPDWLIEIPYEIADIDDPGMTAAAGSTKGTPMMTAPGVGGPWYGILAPEGYRTGDRRGFKAGSIRSRMLPVPLKAQFADAMGHDDAVRVGRIDNVVRRPDGMIAAVGVWDAPVNTDAVEAERQIENKVLAGVSVDLDDVSMEFLNDDGSPADLMEWEPGDPEPMTVVNDGRMASATLCSIPAFQEAFIANGLPPEGFMDGEPLDGSDALDSMPLVASGAPAATLADPGLGGPTAFTVTDDDRVFGHVATWATCHIGLPGACTTPPHSVSGYAYFATGETREGVPVGQITMATGHPDDRMAAQPAKAHYDNTGLVVADVNVGEDAYGIWVAGLLRPDVTEKQKDALRAASLSGDWRRIRGNLELVGILAVNVPGFPIPRTALSMRDGRQVTLVASGVITPAAREHPDVIKSMFKSMFRAMDRAEKANRLAVGIGRDKRSRVAAAAALIEGGN